MNNLPNEILDQVIGELTHKQTLHSLVLCSKSLSIAALPFLYNMSLLDGETLWYRAKSVLSEKAVRAKDPRYLLCRYWNTLLKALHGSTYYAFSDYQICNLDLDALQLLVFLVCCNPSPRLKMGFCDGFVSIPRLSFIPGRLRQGLGQEGRALLMEDITTQMLLFAPSINSITDRLENIELYDYESGQSEYVVDMSKMPKYFTNCLKYVSNLSSLEIDSRLVDAQTCFIISNCCPNLSSVKIHVSSDQSSAQILKGISGNRISDASGQEYHRFHHASRVATQDSDIKNKFVLQLISSKKLKHLSVHSKSYKFSVDDDMLRSIASSCTTLRQLEVSSIQGNQVKSLCSGQVISSISGASQPEIPVVSDAFYMDLSHSFANLVILRLHLDHRGESSRLNSWNYAAQIMKTSQLRKIDLSTCGNIRPQMLMDAVMDFTKALTGQSQVEDISLNIAQGLLTGNTASELVISALSDSSSLKWVRLMGCLYPHKSMNEMRKQLFLRSRKVEERAESYFSKITVHY